VRAEFLDITLAGLCFVAPEIEQRLRQVGPGRGRAGAGQVAGASQLFALAEGLPDAAKKVRLVQARLTVLLHLAVFQRQRRDASRVEMHMCDVIRVS
jgi:hypothetical protein